MKEYFIYERGLQSGPYSIDELRLKTIHTYTPVWKQGLLDWVNAGDLEELNPLFSSAHSFRSSASAELTANLPATLSNDSNQQTLINSRLALWSALIVVSVIALWALVLRNNQPATLQASASITSVDYLQMEQKQPSQYISGKFIDQQNVKGQRVINLELHNDATMAGYRDIVLNLTYISTTGTELGSESVTINESIPAGQSLKTQIKAKAAPAVSDVRIRIESAQ